MFNLSVICTWTEIWIHPYDAGKNNCKYFGGQVSYWQIIFFPISNAMPHVEIRK